MKQQEQQQQQNESGFYGCCCSDVPVAMLEYVRHGLFEIPQTFVPQESSVILSQLGMRSKLVPTPSNYGKTKKDLGKLAESKQSMYGEAKQEKNGCVRVPDQVTMNGRRFFSSFLCDCDCLTWDGAVQAVR